MPGLSHPGSLGDGTVELRRWCETDIPCVAARYPDGDASAWVRRQQARGPGIGVSCAVALPGAAAVGYAGLIRRPRIELGIATVHPDGTAGFHTHDRVVGIGYWVVADAQRAGVATRAARLLSRWAIEHAGMLRVEALVDPDNVASLRVAEKAGFRLEGRLRGYLEVDGRRSDALVLSLTPDDV